MLLLRAAHHRTRLIALPNTTNPHGQAQYSHTETAFDLPRRFFEHSQGLKIKLGSHFFSERQARDMGDMGSLFSMRPPWSPGRYTTSLNHTYVAQPQPGTSV